jgi:hypothetical protein
MADKSGHFRTSTNMSALHCSPVTCSTLSRSDHPGEAQPFETFCSLESNHNITDIPARAVNRFVAKNN